MPTKKRLDMLLVEQSLAESREQARRLIMAGEVFVNESRVDKPGKTVDVEAAIRVRTALKYVSRGGLKLEGALAKFPIEIEGLTALDVGACTGGFTDCLLQRGADHVYSVDVGYGQLAWTLRNDPRVTVLERTNIRYLERLPDGRESRKDGEVDEESSAMPKGNVLADLAVIDTSFISLRLVIPATARLLSREAQIIALIKPQFEAGKEDVGKGGVVRDRKVHKRVLNEITTFVQQKEFKIAGLTPSPVVGPAGNVEFLIWLQSENGQTVKDIQSTIEDALRAAEIVRKNNVKK